MAFGYKVFPHNTKIRELDMFSLGQKVNVDLSGLRLGGMPPLEKGTTTTGVVTGTTHAWAFLVRLDKAFGGVKDIAVFVERLSPAPTPSAH